VSAPGSGGRREHPGFWRTVFSARPWAATGYLFSYVVLAPALFAVALTVVAVTFPLSITLFGLPLLVGSALIVRGCANLERARALLVTGPIPARYATVTGSGLLAQIRTRWSDRATLRDCGYLIGMFPILYVLDTTVFALWVAVLAGLALPLWYWAVPQSWDDGVDRHGVMIGYVPQPGRTFFHGGYGFWIGDLRAALIAAAVFLVLVLLMAYLVTATARLHARVARHLLGPYVDPLAEARDVLRMPGPLPTPEVGAAY